ncbi:MAG: ATP-binding protein [Polyangiales bacterium]
MSLRGQLIGATAALTLATLGGAFAVVFVAVNHAQELRLDAALRAQAEDEARYIAGRPDAELRGGPGPFANGVGPLPRFEALLDGAGATIDATPGFARRLPDLARAGGDLRQPFDVWCGGVHLRAVRLAVPDGSGRRLLFATPRTDLDGDEAFLRRAMLLVFAVAVGWSVAVATWIVRRLTRAHQAITRTVRRVAAGDLAARVALTARDREVDQLSHDVDEMIARLERLVSQQRRFVANAAHELRLPLTTLLGELSLALRRDRDEAAYRETIEGALGDTRRLKLLADELLTLARIGSEPEGASSAVSLRQVALAAVESVEGLAQPRGVTLRVEGEARTRGRAADLQRLIRNLLENAVRFSPSGGTVRVLLSPEGERVSLTVLDEGVGVPEAEREKIFEPFYRASGHRGEDDLGAGLGLAIVREIAEAHRGTVRCEAPPPARPGGVFCVRLPAA